MQKEIEKIFVELIQQSLNLPNNYGKDEDGNVIPCVTIRAQNIKLFNTPHLQVTIQTVSNQVFANRKEYFEEEKIINGEPVTTFNERLMLNEQRQMQIDVYSRNNEARERFWEVQAALTSTLSEQLQDKYQFRIAKISNAINTSGLEGGSDINRYTIRFNCLSWQEKVNTVEYYTQFHTQARTTNTNIFADFIIGEQGEWNSPHFSLVDFSNVQEGVYDEFQGGFSNFTNFSELEGGFADYEQCKEIYQRVQPQ